MRTFEQWMREYGQSHTNKTNILIHKLCVPVIMFSVLGLLWCLPFPFSSYDGDIFNWSTVAVFLSLAFYLTLNRAMFIGMLLMCTFMIFLITLIPRSSLLAVSIFLFILSWVVQFYGHKIEGKKPSFMQDLAFLLIGPLWVLRFLYRKLGITF